MKTMTNLKTDAEIKRDVLQELKWDQRVDETDVGVQVKSGLVSLVGSIESYAKKQAACDAAHRVPGVLDVVNEIEVRIATPWGKTDPEIAQMVRHALTWDAFAPDEKIKSTVAKGWVTLEGDVEFAYQREDAERVVERLNGVRGVTNMMVVKPKAVDAAQIRSSILEALERRTEREAQHLDIKVIDGIVSLGGKVQSWSEKHSIEKVARHARGVRNVDNRLVVDPLI